MRFPNFLPLGSKQSYLKKKKKKKRPTKVIMRRQGTIMKMT